MHIPEGVLTAPVLLSGAALAAAGVSIGLRKMSGEDVIKTAVLSSAFFVASLIHVPIGISSAHLLLNGLAGVVLGWAVFPAVFVGLLLQAVLFGFGSITALGVNTFNIALPGLCCFYLFNARICAGGARTAFILGFATGALSVIGAGVLLSAAIFTSGKGFGIAIAELWAGHIPVIVIEGLVTGWAVAFVHKVKPEVLALTRTAAEVPHRAQA